MDAFEFIDAVGAEIACNRAVINVNNERTIVAKIIGGVMTLTPEGQDLKRALDAANNEEKAKPASKAASKAARKPAAKKDQEPDPIDQLDMDFDE